ncbi:MAG TPA: long-chain fatty acid--CoA ligase, partial [Candidatus Paceibacterota bacterium]|nr:long-chain fatty acid--CoA ligase [Candidatus Paceibacterota bacterium]
HVAGHKVFPEEIAAVLDHHPAVLHSRISAQAHPQMGEAIHAEVQLRPGQNGITSEDIIAYCRKRLSSQKVPATLKIVANIATTTSGKVRHG